MAEASFASSAESFLQYLTEVRQLSHHTVSNYQRDLRGLQAYCEAQGLDTASELDESHIRRWISQLHRRGLASSSIQRSL